MASIYGYEALLTQEGRKRYFVSYTIRKDGRVIGTFTDFQTDHAAIDIPHPSDLALFRMKVKEYYTAFPATLHGEEAFIRELLDLGEVEAAFQMHEEKGYPITVKLSFRKRVEEQEEWIKRVGDKKVIPPDRMYPAGGERHVRNILRREEYGECQVYRSLRDFNIE